MTFLAFGVGVETNIMQCCYQLVYGVGGPRKSGLYSPHEHMPPFQSLSLQCPPGVGEVTRSPLLSLPEPLGEGGPSSPELISSTTEPSGVLAIII